MKSSPEILTILARDEDWRVRWRVALNPPHPKPMKLLFNNSIQGINSRWSHSEENLGMRILNRSVKSIMYLMFLIRACGLLIWQPIRSLI
jgi:hypothetical protein